MPATTLTPALHCGEQQDGAFCKHCGESILREPLDQLLNHCRARASAETKLAVSYDKQGRTNRAIECRQRASQWSIWGDALQAKLAPKEGGAA